MAYTPIGWQTGDTITAEKMNKMDNGWGVSETERQLLCDETVTTTGSPAFGVFTYSTEITASSIIVTFNGVEYNCPWNTAIPGYGDFNFVEYPFVIDFYDGENELGTQTAGTYTVKIETGGVTSVEVSQNFINVVALHATVGVTTFQEVQDAIDAGRIVVVSSEYGMSFVSGYDALDTPLKIYAVGANDEGATSSTYVATSTGDAIQLPF